MRKYNLSDFISYAIAVALSFGGLYLSAGGWEQLEDNAVVHLTAMFAGSYFFGWYALCINEYLQKYGVKGIIHAYLYNYYKPMVTIIIAGTYWASACIWFVFI